MAEPSRTSRENPDDRTTTATPLRPLYQRILLWSLVIIGFASWDSYQSYQYELNYLAERNKALQEAQHYDKLLRSCWRLSGSSQLSPR